MMTSKEKIQIIREIFDDVCKHSNYYISDESYEIVDDLEKDLEEKELLESELKLEKDKVQYVMKQLKKQDKILEILEPYTELKYDEVNDEYNLIIDASERIPLSEDYEINMCSLGVDEKDVLPIKEWLNEK